MAEQEYQIYAEKWGINPHNAQLCLSENGDFTTDIKPKILKFDINVFPNLELLKKYLKTIMYIIIKQFPVEYLIDLHKDEQMYQRFRDDSLVIRKTIWKALVEEYFSRWVIIMHNDLQMDYSKEPFT